MKEEASVQIPCTGIKGNKGILRTTLLPTV